MSERDRLFGFGRDEKQRAMKEQDQLRKLYGDNLGPLIEAVERLEGQAVMMMQRIESFDTRINKLGETVDTIMNHIKHYLHKQALEIEAWKLLNDRQARRRLMEEENTR